MITDVVIDPTMLTMHPSNNQDDQVVQGNLVDCKRWIIQVTRPDSTRAINPITSLSGPKRSLVNLDMPSHHPIVVRIVGQMHRMMIAPMATRPMIQGMTMTKMTMRAKLQDPMPPVLMSRDRTTRTPETDHRPGMVVVIDPNHPVVANLPKVDGPNPNRLQSRGTFLDARGNHPSPRRPQKDGSIS